MEAHKLKNYGKFITVFGLVLVGLGVLGVINGESKGIGVIGLGICLFVTGVYLVAGYVEKARLAFYSIGAVASVVLLYFIMKSLVLGERSTLPPLLVFIAWYWYYVIKYFRHRRRPRKEKEGTSDSSASGFSTTDAS